MAWSASLLGNNNRGPRSYGRAVSRHRPPRRGRDPGDLSQRRRGSAEHIHGTLAARLCTAGAITVNQATIRKANHMVRIGDTIAVPQGAFRRSVRLLGLGIRRGPAADARRLYEEIAAPVHRSELTPAWTPLLVEEDGALTRDRRSLSGKQFRY